MANAKIIDLQQMRGALLPQQQVSVRSWSLEFLAGQLIELSDVGGGALSLAVRLLIQAQYQGEPVTWLLAGTNHLPYGEDLQNAGLDLRACPIVRVQDAKAAIRSADRLIRSGAFGLLVLDLLGLPNGHQRPIRDAELGRLLKLADKHDCVVLFMTSGSPEQGSLGSMIGLHAVSDLRETDDGRFQVRLHAVKDKRTGPGWELTEEFDGPPGMCLFA